MSTRVEILDHGYLDLIETWGSDERIVEAARMSTGKGFLGWGTPEEPGDEKLLRYLHQNKHTSPFEMGGLIVEVQAPIMVFREWHRHRTQSYNEMSARYTPLPDLNYVPTVDRLTMISTTNKQAGTIKGADALTPFLADLYRAELKEVWKQQEAFYQRWLQAGVPKELARAHLGVGRYSRMRASANLRNWLGFLILRLDVKAQWEIRQYALALGDLVARYFPRTWELFMEGKPREKGQAL